MDIQIIFLGGWDSKGLEGVVFEDFIYAFLYVIFVIFFMVFECELKYSNMCAINLEVIF